MKKNIFHLLVFGFYLLPLLVSCGGKAEEVTLADERDTLSWAMGVSLAESTKSGFYDFNPTLVKAAFESAMEGGTQPLDTDTYRAACQYLAFLAQKHQRDELAKATEESTQSESALFERILEGDPDLKKSPEGYYYKVIKEGKGPKAQLGQRIRFDFVSTDLLTGKEYVNSYTRAMPPGAERGIAHVLGNPMIPGMQSGMQMMNAGSKYLFYFPSRLAFGAQGADGLPPFTPLRYEIELYAIYND